MSLTGTSKDYWSATTGCTIRERCKFMFNNKLLSEERSKLTKRTFLQLYNKNVYPDGPRTRSFKWGEERYG